MLKVLTIRGESMLILNAEIL
ncbi:UNVERIFIED_CONTAM: hypothetical protein NCL1_18206 [Trichonephila clavipes]